MSKVNKKKQGYIILAVFALIAIVVIVFSLKKTWDDNLRTVRLDNGDEIAMNQGGIGTETLASQSFDESYVLLSEKEFAEAFPEYAAENNKVKLPERQRI